MLEYTHLTDVDVPIYSVLDIIVSHCRVCHVSHSSIQDKDLVESLTPSCKYKVYVSCSNFSKKNEIGCLTRPIWRDSTSQKSNLR